MTPDEFRREGHRLIDWIADYRERVADRPVMAQVAPGEVRAMLPQAPPEAPEPMAAVLADLDRVVLPGITHWQSPRFFGYFPAVAPLAGVLGDLVSTGLGVIGLSWQSGPAITELEEVVTDWVRQMVGLSPAWSGVIQDTASTSSLVALLCARERTTGYAMARGGMQEGGAPLLVYASAQSHSSVEKAALLAGFGRDHLRLHRNLRSVSCMRAPVLDSPGPGPGNHAPVQPRSVRRGKDLHPRPRRCGPSADRARCPALARTSSGCRWRSPRAPRSFARARRGPHPMTKPALAEWERWCGNRE